MYDQELLSFNTDFYNIKTKITFRLSSTPPLKSYTPWRVCFFGAGNKRFKSILVCRSFLPDVGVFFFMFIKGFLCVTNISWKRKKVKIIYFATEYARLLHWEKTYKIQGIKIYHTIETSSDIIGSHEIFLMISYI